MSAKVAIVGDTISKQLPILKNWELSFLAFRTESTTMSSAASGHALLRAAAAGDLDAVKVYVSDASGDAHGIVDKHGSDALMWAAGAGHIEEFHIWVYMGRASAR